MASNQPSPSKQQRKHQAQALGLVLLFLTLLWAASLTRTWHALEFKTFDLFSALAAPGQAAQPITIIAVDEPSFTQLGTGWPFPRQLHATLIDRLRQDGAAAVGLDMVFADPGPDAAQDQALAQALTDAHAAGVPVVLASARERVDNAGTTLWMDVPPLTILLEAGAIAGDAGVQPHEDFVVRQMPAQADGFALQIARAWAGGQALGTSPTDNGMPRFIRYRGARGTFDTRSYYQALEPGLLPPDFFKGKLVLVGRSARTASELQRSQSDVFNAPFATVGGERLLPGVELQANILDNWLQGDSLRLAPDSWSMAIVALAVLLLLPLGLRSHPAAAAGWSGFFALGIVVLSASLWNLSNIWFPPLLPLAAVAGLYAATTLLAWAAARQRARQTRAMFAQYVPPEVVKRLIAQPELLRLGGELREVTVLFTDLANFTNLSERLSAEQTVQVLTAYFNTMTPLIHASGGTVDKFIGDAIMAFWGAPLPDPQHAQHAVQTALAMQQAMGKLVADLQAQGLPPITMRIGIHSGPVVVGNIGAEQRFSYTVIGDTVNLASRLEAANKNLSTGILLSAATAAQLPSHIAVQPLGEIHVAGKAAAIAVFTPTLPAS